VRRENALRDLFELTEDKLPEAGQTARGVSAVGVPEGELLQKRHGHPAALRATLRQLVRRGWVQSSNKGGRELCWRLTPAGMTEAYRVVRQHRLWELFLMYETTLGLTVVDRDADAVEHFLPPEALHRLEALLEQHGLEPRLKPVETYAAS